MKLKLFLLLMAIVSLKGFSQKYELGKVTVDELKEKSYSNDSSAVAAVLFEKGKTSFVFKQGEGFTVVTEVETKIKIYKKGGYEWANEIISFYTGGITPEEVSIEKAVTYNLVDGEIVKTKLKKEGEFVEKKNKFWSQKKIVMPNVSEGSIIEFKYIIKSVYRSSLRDWNFQRRIPVKYSEFTTEIPQYYTYNIFRKGFLKPKEIKSDRTKRASFTDKTISSQAGKAYDVSNEVVTYNDVITTYQLENIPAMKDEAYVDNISNYMTSVQYELSSTKFPNSQPEFYTTTWEDVAKKIYDESDFGNQLNKKNYFEDDLKTVLKDVTAKQDKISVIYDFVKSRMNWDGAFGYLCDKGVNKAYQERTGNVAEINLMLIAMLRNAGIETNPVLVSTRSNGINLFPSRNAYNYVIAAVEIENGLILLDATNKNAMPNVLPERALNWVGRIIRQNGSSAEVDLSPNILSKKIVNVMAAVTPDGTVSGKVREQYYDYYAFAFRNNFGGLSEDNYLEKLEKKYNGIEIDAYKSSNKTDLTKQIVEDYSFSHSGLSDKIADKIYINPMLFFTENENPFKQEKREYPVDFIFPNQDKYTISINLPEGYVVESIPAPLNLSMEEGLGNFSFNIVSNGNQIQLSALVSFNTSVIPANYYEMLKSFYKNVVEKNKEKIVLKKA